MGVFDEGGQSKADVFSRGKWFQEGFFIVKIVKCLYKPARRGGTDSYIIETEVLYAHSNHEKAPDVGEKATQIIKDNDMVLQNIMQFMCALYDVPSPKAYSDEKWQKFGNRVFVKQEAGKKSAAEGQILRVDCVNKVTTKGNDFTIHNWSQPSEEDMELVEGE